MIEKDHAPVKKEIGRRFKKFRETIGKTQAELAHELDVYQSTITNIEVGKTFPGVKYLHYFQYKYRLNVNWLLDNHGEILGREDSNIHSCVSLLGCHIPKNDPMYEKYAELVDLMQIPVVEHVVLAKILELKVIAKNEIENFLKARSDALSEKQA
jgi:DNA-binding XRE family transcriptional regulator